MRIKWPEWPKMPEITEIDIDKMYDRQAEALERIATALEEIAKQLARRDSTQV